MTISEIRLAYEKGLESIRELRKTGLPVPTELYDVLFGLIAKLQESG